ncbi:MAG: zinc ABC transporter substrate-binding protein [Spirochaetales bacterium]|nr:zinc ABC transporter substrate-binding protein [Spirochaetales bacterium]
MKKLVLGLLLLVSTTLLFARGEKEPALPEEGGRLGAFVSILPQKTFVERIGGDRVSVSVMVEPGKSPATYSPTPRQVSALGEAQVFFTIGVAFERAFLPAVQKNLKNLLIVDTSEGIEKRPIEGHDHGDEEDHGHEAEEPDPHIWMSPVLVKKQAWIIAETLTKLDPAGAAYYRKNLESFITNLDTLDARLAEVLKPYAGQTIFVYHPAFGYFADRYGLKQVAIETGGKEPTPATLNEIIEHAKEEGVRVIFVQPEFPADSAAAVAAALNGSVVTVAPLAADYFENLERLAEALAGALKP